MDNDNNVLNEIEPLTDKDAALRFSLAIVMLDHRTDDLLQLLKGGDGLGGLVGDPGWTIERREADEVVGYEAWPDWARFRAYVEPDEYALAYPEFYADTATFLQYVEKAIGAYERRHPERSDIARELKEAMKFAAAQPTTTPERGPAQP